MILPQGSKEAAERVAAKLCEEGFSASVRQDKDGVWVVTLGEDDEAA